MEYCEVVTKSDDNLQDPNRYEVLFHYLQHGVLPATLQIREFDLQTAIFNLIERFGKEFTCWESIMCNRTVCLRFLKCLDDLCFEDMMLKADTVSAKSLFNSIEIIKEKTRKLFLQPLLHFEPLKNTVIRREILQTISEEENLSLEDYLRKMLVVRMLIVNYFRTLSDSEITRLALGLKEDRKRFMEDEFSSETIPPLEILLFNEIKQRRISLPDIGFFNSTLERNNFSIFEESKPRVKEYLVHNAGLLILWPGIMQLFKQANLLDKGTFVSNEATEKGMLLLHYLFSGEEQPKEYELLLNKVLCGSRIHTPILHSSFLTISEKDSCLRLLQMVCREWKTMKMSSVDMLRHNFLQRHGKLRKNAKGWELNVQRQPWDGMLDKLPWGISVFRLPWMKKLIITNW